MNGRRRRPDWFLRGMVAAVALAWVAPVPGASGGSLHPEILTKAGIALIFLLHGLSLSFPALRAGALRWPVHLVVQLTTFVAFPLLGIGLLRATRGWLLPDDLALGFFYLCALPSTVSSSVAMTAAARGNVAAAVFNATASSLLGIVLTPLWVGWWVGDTGRSGSLPVGAVIVDLLKWLVLPLVVGQLVRPWLGAWAGRHKRGIGVADRLTILLLVYTSFCDSVERGVWSGQGSRILSLAAGGSALLFGLVLAGTWLTCEALRFPSGDRAAAVFCGSKKTLASGVPMAQLLFAGDARLGVILLPILIYHPLQLLACGWLAGHWGRIGPRTTSLTDIRVEP